MEQTGRVGWAARGALYLVVALLVARVPTTSSSREADQRGALEAVGDRALGGVLLAVVAAGLAAFAIFRAVQAIRGHDEKPGRRAGWGFSSIVYAHLAVTAVRVLLRNGGRRGEQRALTARVLGWPGGPVVVGALGVGLLLTSLNFVRKAVKERFRVDIDERSVPRVAWPAIKIVGIAGWLGRALVWGLVGWFVLRAAVQHDSTEPVGLDETLRAMVDERWGVAVIWVAVVGLAAFGLLCLATAMWLDERPATD